MDIERGDFMKLRTILTRFLPFPLLAFGFLAVLPGALRAQEVSSVVGTVADKSGGAIKDVEISLTNANNGFAQTAKTNEVGAYKFLRVPPGSGYLLTFSRDGFQKVAIGDLYLAVNTASTRDVVLEVGSVNQLIEVKAAAEATLNTTDASVGNAFDSRLLHELPIQFRDSPAALLGLQPGVVTASATNDPSGNRDGAVTGARADQGNITVDGIDANDQATGQAFATVGNAPIDAIQEFRGVTAGETAEFGRSSGAQIQLVTKSGGNDWHGAAYEYHRNTITAANSFFNNKIGVARPALIRNQFGTSLGGPVKKNKLFFFFNYEGRRDASQDQESRTVPLDHVRNGVIGYIKKDPACGAFSRLDTSPQCILFTTPTGRNSLASMDPAGIGTDAALLTFVDSRYPHANDLSGGDGINTGGLRFNAPFALGNNTYTSRIDYNLTNNQKFFGRFNIVRSAQTDDVNNVTAQFPGDAAPASKITTRDYAFVIGHTWNISSNNINQAAFGITSSRLGFPAIFQPSFPNRYTFAPNTTGTPLFSRPFPSFQSQFRTVPVPTLRDDFTHIHGHHQWQFGGVFKPQHQTSTQINDFNFVSIGLGGGLQGLTALERPDDIRGGTIAPGEWDQVFPFLLGRFASVSTNFNLKTDGSGLPPGSGKTRNYRYYEYEGYAQDQWKVNSSLTLTMGLRYVYYSVPYETNGLQSVSNIDFRTYINDRLAAAAQGIEGDTALPFLKYDLGGKANPGGRGIYAADKNNFSPRVSFAYNPGFRSGVLKSIFGEHKTVIRGGGTILCDRVNANTINFIQDQVSYLFNTSSTTNFGDLATDPRFTALGTLPVTNTPQPVTHPLAPFVSNGVPFGNAEGQFNYAVDPHFRTPFAYVYSLGVQRELPGRFLVEVDYVGRLGRKLFSQADAGQVVNFKDATSGQFLLPAFTALTKEIRANQLSGNTTVTPQPWFENQIGMAMATGGLTCGDFGEPNCTQFVADFFGTLAGKGDVSDTLQALQSFTNFTPTGFLPNNSGLPGQFSTNAYITNLGSSSYNAMLVTLRKNLSRNLQFDFNYTYSHSIDNESSIGNTVVGGLVCDVTNLRVCRGNSDFDATHLFSANGVYDLPLGRGQWLGRTAPGWVNQIIGAWQLGAIFSAHSGFAFSTNTGTFPVGFVFDSPAVLTGDAAALSRHIHTADDGTIQYFADQTAASAALSNPLPGQIGNRNNLRGPKFVNFDMSLGKRFNMPWSEKHTVQFRAEAYNTFNHTNFADPSANLNDSTFGQITTQANSNRVMQFALRYDF
jgi:carboxypeptidase family protein